MHHFIASSNIQMQQTLDFALPFMIQPAIRLPILIFPAKIGNGLVNLKEEKDFLLQEQSFVYFSFFYSY